MAHPDDEVLWAGGTILLRQHWSWHVASLCRGDDADREPKFQRTVAQLGAAGSIGELDDGPEQNPLDDAQVRKTVLSLVPAARYDLILTHGPRGEYTRHRRHEETCRAVAGLWADGALSAEAVWMFGFEDGGGAYLPRAQAEATRQESFSEEIWRRKYRLMTEDYGFAPESWEARATPRSEAFWCFHDAQAACRWVERRTPARAGDCRMKGAEK